MMAMVLYVGIALIIDIEEASKTTIKIDYLTVPIILTPMTMAIFLLAFRFHRLLQALNVKIPLAKSILIYLLGLSFAVTPLSSGQLVRSQIIKKEFDYAFSKTSPIFLFEKWSEFSSLLVILFAFIFVNFMIESIFVIVLGAAMAMLFFGLMRKRGVAFFFLGKITAKFQRLRKFEESIENSQESLKILSSKKVVFFEGFIVTIPSLLLQAVSVFLAFQALGIKIDFIASTQIFYTALIAGIFSFVPGGLGVTEGGMIALLSKYYFNYDLGLLAAAVIFVRLITFWYGTLLGGITGLIKYRSFMVSKQQSDI
jgi:glycosyltransferase 2 family protein